MEERKPTMSVKKDESVDVGRGGPSRAMKEKEEEDVKPRVSSLGRRKLVKKEKIEPKVE